MIKNNHAINCLYFLIFLLLTGCPQKLDNDKLDFLLSRISEGGATETGISATEQALAPIATEVHKTAYSAHGGIPRSITNGFCGDGVMNGDLEQCDKEAMPSHECEFYGGIAGYVKCDDRCFLDLSGCITPAVDLLLGNVGEPCACRCGVGECEGTCDPLNDHADVSKCQYLCNNPCECVCKDKFKAQLDFCQIECTCELIDGNAPDCDCNLAGCLGSVGTTPYIGIAAARALGVIQ